MRTPLFAAAVSLALVSACTGQIQGGVSAIDVATSSTVKEACSHRSVASQPLRRLSSEQYAAVLVSLFGPALGPQVIAGSTFPPTVIRYGFSADAEANSVNTSQSNAIEDNAERIASLILAGPQPYLHALLPCAPGGSTPVTAANIDSCVDAFITRFGEAAYRRPLSASEVAVARTVYDAVRPEQGAEKAWASVVQFFVQSPGLLYRIERGTGAAVPDASTLTPLTQLERATRLSFLFLNGPPDAELLAAAAEQRLSTPAEVAVQARRLAHGVTFTHTLTGFLRDWLHLYETPTKDARLFPSYTEQVRSSMARQPEALVEQILERGDGALQSLLSTSNVPVDSTLASFLGVAAPASAWQSVAVPHRRGLFSLPGVMAALSKSDQTSPIHRGNFVRVSVLCGPTLNLPANVDTATPLQDTSTAPTVRERLAPLTTLNQCAGCHRQFNPLGFALENYDAVGRWRDTENGATIDASGSLTIGETPTDFSGPESLFEQLAHSQQVQSCFALQSFRAALGRAETPADECSLAVVQTQVQQRGGDLRELLVALTQTDAFLYRQTTE